jgi:hypothetical protein
MARNERSNTKINGGDVGEEERGKREMQEVELMFCAERWLQKGGILVVIGDVDVGVELYESMRVWGAGNGASICVFSC